jgi:hypothetical protein
MSNYFHGYRRKIGVVTLVMACVFLSIWIHSLAYPNTFMISLGNDHYFLIHANQNWIWARETTAAPMWSDETILFHTDLWSVSMPHFVSTILPSLLSAYLLLSNVRNQGPELIEPLQ